MTITPAQENERTAPGSSASARTKPPARLAQTVAITSGDGITALFAAELANQLGRTVTIAGDGAPIDIEVVIGTAPAPREAPKRLFVTLDTDTVAFEYGAEQGAAGNDLAWRADHDRHLYRGFGRPGIHNRRHRPRLRPRLSVSVVRFDALGANPLVLQTPIELTDTVLVGAGAVANGFLRAARHMTIRGELTVADPKLVGKGNPNRCLYFDDRDVDHAKADRLCANAQKDFAGLKLVPKLMTFAQIVRERGRVRRAITTADSRRARRSVQKDLPLEALDASTTDVSEVIVHSHRQPIYYACLCCIYKHIPDEDARARDIASGLGIDLEDVTSGQLIGEVVAGKIAARHPALNAATLVGMAFDSLFKQLCAENALLSPTGAQVFAPFACVSNLLERCLRWNWRVSKPACASRTETTICSQARGRPLTAASVSTGRVSSIASFAGGRKRWRRGLWSGRNAIGATDTPRNSLYRPLRAP